MEPPPSPTILDLDFNGGEVTRGSRVTEECSQLMGIGTEDAASPTEEVLDLLMAVAVGEGGRGGRERERQKLN